MQISVTVENHPVVGEPPRKRHSMPLPLNGSAAICPEDAAIPFFVTAVLCLVAGAGIYGLQTLDALQFG